MPRNHIRVFLFLFTLQLLAAGSASAQSRCDLSASPEYPDLVIDSVEVAANPVPHCIYHGTIGTEIHFRLLLPDSWNGKFVMGGDGGFAGTLNNQAVSLAAIGGENILQAGYATVSTDVGHNGGGRASADWALNNLERIVNYGHQGVHRTAVSAKSLISDYYGQEVERSYFYGCSNGGREALMEAQRYPTDFDGIIAGAPAYNFTGAMSQFIRSQQAMFPNRSNLSQALLSADELTILENAVLLRCDANDGVQDGILNDPRSCNYQVSELPACAAGDTESCFTEAEIAAVKTVYDGPMDPSGNQLFYGFPFGGEPDAGGWNAWITGGVAAESPSAYPNAHYYFSLETMRYMVKHDPDWQFADYDMSSYLTDTRTLAATLNATSPDLSAFRGQGGKLLIYQGWSDPAISALATIGYHEQVLAHDPGASDDVRLFLMPGVLHCSGGKGPFSVKFLETLDNWVETGVAPSRLTAHFVEGNRPVEAARPLCAYPEVAVYQGTGDTRDEASFVCSAP